uniref:Uncharacterized protein n=1 Tax=Leersia perrieri TaxID=77586 RepID=A0A0D9XJX1_9ORYZ
MEESAADAVVHVKDIPPKVFDALLQFIYTDTFPAKMEADVEGDQISLTNLLVAADRYDLERLKLMCEDKLYKCIDVGNVAYTLAVADHCDVLRRACIYFIASRGNLEAIKVNTTEDFEPIMYRHLGFAYDPNSYIKILKKLARCVMII